MGKFHLGDGPRPRSIPLVDDGSDLIKTAALLTSDILGVGGVDDDGKVAGGLLDFNTGVTGLSELTS